MQNTDILNELEEINSKPQKGEILEVQDQDNKKKDDLLSSSILLEVEEEIDENANFEIVEETQIKEKWKILWYVKFLIKYSITSLWIFLVLLVSTNYNAYLSIINSYIKQEEMEENEQSIIKSVNASYIKEKIIEKKEEEKVEEEKDNETDKNQNSTSITNILNKTKKEDISLNIEITPYENRIVIPKIWKNVPLVEVKNKKVSWEKELNDIFMQELESWVVRYPGSQKPWEEWNTFIFWHSSNFPWIKWDYNEVFALLDKVSFDDEIIVYYWQKKYKYKVREKYVINPWDVSLLKRNENKSELTLMTCWPIWTTLNRLVVITELIENET